MERLLAKSEEERQVLEIGGKRIECGCETVSLESRRINWLGKCSRIIEGPFKTSQCNLGWEEWEFLYLM